MRMQTMWPRMDCQSKGTESLPELQTNKVERNGKEEGLSFPMPLSGIDNGRYRIYCRWCGTYVGLCHGKYCCTSHDWLWRRHIANKTNARRKDHKKVGLNKKLVFQRDSFTCQSCGNLDSLHLHHIIPVSMGGTDNLDNLITLCKKCHRQKHKTQLKKYIPPEIQSFKEVPE